MTPGRAASALAALLATLPLAAQEPSPDVHPSGTHAIPRAEQPIALDGLLDEPAWNSAWSYELGYEVTPGENIPAIVRTEVLVTHTDSHLYVGFRVFDPEPSAISAHLSDRDNIGNDDWVGVVLDTFNDERRNYLLLVNPYGVQMDQIEAWPDGGTVWDGIWDSAARITDWGWSVELEIPFSTLRFQRSEGPQVWGFDAIRGYPRNIFRQFGAFARDRGNNCYLCQSVKIEGFEGVSPGRNLELVPTLTASRLDAREDLPDGPLENGSVETEVGLTARWGFTPNLTLSAALNPDFSQVEADARQLAVNRPFALFFPEKRPFFMEGADFFSTQLNAVYTRMIRDPAWGLKLTGKEGAHTVGAYAVNDDVTNLIFPGSQGSAATSLDMSSLAGVARYKYDVGNRFTLGMLATARQGEDYRNGVAGLDADLRLSDKDRLQVQVMGSSTRYPDDVAEEFDQPTDEFSDWAANVFFTHDTRTWGLWAFYRDVAPGFRADLGFMPKVDYRHSEVGYSYLRAGSEEQWYSELLLLTKVSHIEDHDGNLLEDEFAIRFNYQGPLQTHAYIRPSLAREGYNGQEFDINEVDIHICLKPNRHSHAFLNAIVGDQVDYANTRPGKRLFIEPGFWYRIGRHLRLEMSYTHEDMDVDEGWLYKAGVGQLNLSWQFNARAFIRAIVHHVDYDFNTALYSDGRDPESRHLFTQLLFSYKLNPQTVFFLGYSDNSVANQEYELTKADRTIFLKIGYAFVF